MKDKINAEKFSENAESEFAVQQKMHQAILSSTHNIAAMERKHFLLFHRRKKPLNIRLRDLLVQKMKKQEKQIIIPARQRQLEITLFFLL